MELGARALCHSITSLTVLPIAKCDNGYEHIYIKLCLLPTVHTKEQCLTCEVINIRQ